MTNAFDVLANHLRHLVDGFEVGKQTPRGDPEPGSPADLEIQDTTFGAPWGESPAQDLANHVRLLAVSANDHMLTLADSLQSQTTGINSSYTIARGLLEASSRAWYLAEPGIDLRERLRRYMNERLWSIHEAKRFLDGMGDDPAKLDPIEQRISESATTFSYQITVATRRDPAYLNSPRPTIMRCIDDAAASRGMNQGFGETVYRHLSSVAHGAETGLVGTLLETPAAGTLMTFGKNSEQQAKHFIVPLLVYVSMAERFIAHFGWSTAHWNPACDDALSFWVNHASPGPTAAVPDETSDDPDGNTAPSE